MNNCLVFKKFETAVCENCGCVRKNFKRAVFTDLVTSKDYVVTLVDGDVAKSLERGQLVIVNLLQDEATFPWDPWYVAESITALDKRVVDLRHKKRQVK